MGALEPIMGTLAEPAGDASSSSTVAISSGVSSTHCILEYFNVKEYRISANSFRGNYSWVETIRGNTVSTL